MNRTSPRRLSPTAPLLALDDAEEDIFVLRRLLLKAEVGHPFQPLLSPDAFMVWLPTVVAPESKVERPLLCFLDINMPGATDFDVLRWIRRQSDLDDLPVIMLSSSDDPRDVTNATKLGAQCYLTKYPSTAVLAQVVKDAEAYADGSGKSAFAKSYNLLNASRRGSQESD